MRCYIIKATINANKKNILKEVIKISMQNVINVSDIGLSW